MKHCCVIGGTGFIGQHLVDQLLRLERKVLVIGRKETPSEALPTGVAYHCHGANDRHRLLDVLDGVDEIIDLAYSTTPQTSFNSPVNDIVSNVPDTVSLFEIAAMLPIRKFVWVSSGGTVYGNAGAGPICEDAPTHPVSPYGITKLAIEKYARMYFEISGLPIVCVRPSNAYGEGQRPFMGQGFIATAIANILNNTPIKMFGQDGTIRDYIHVADLAAGIIATLTKGVSGQVYNISTGLGHSNRQVVEMLSIFADKLDLRAEIDILPARKFDVASNVLSYEKIRSETGWQPRVDFQQGLERTWHWLANRRMTK